ncbi:MAG: hypothetical protein QXF82_08490 [Nitrososphaeria archaeon]
MHIRELVKNLSTKIKELAKIGTLSLPSNKKFLLLLTAGVAIRFALAPFTEQRWDMYTWRLHQAFTYQYRINPFWPTQALEFAWGYPPLWLFTLLLVYPIYTIFCPTSYPQEASQLWNPYNTATDPQQRMTLFFESYKRFLPTPQGQVEGLNLPFLDLLIKTPIIFSDILIAILLYKIVKSISNEKNAEYASLAWLLNPYVIWMSSVWGMFDSIPTLFILLSTYYLLQGKIYKSALTISIATLYKLYPLILIPINTIIISKKEGSLKKAIKYCLISIAVTLLVIIATYFAFALYTGQESLNLSIKLTYNLFLKRASPDWEGKNIIAGLTPLILLQDKLGATNIPISPVLLSIALTITMIKLIRNKEITAETILSYVTAAHFIIYMTYTVVNPQYFIWILPLLLMLTAKKDRKLKYLYWAISIMPLSTIICTYDLSYHISPYFITEYQQVYIRPEILASTIALTIFYIASIKLVFLKKAK